MRVAKVDANQPEIVAAFRKCGFQVAHIHTVGKGVPDIIVARAGNNVLVEIKDGGKSLTDDEKRFHATWPGDLRIVRNVDDVLKIAKDLP